MTANESMYNPNKYGNAQGKNHHVQKYYDATGTYFQHGNGCHVCENCLECPDIYANNCQYNEKKKR
jgi:hypothetical protein